MINNSYKQINPDKSLKWTVKVKEGSNLIGYYTADISSVSPIVNTIKEDLKNLEKGIDEHDEFNKPSMQNLQTLCDISKNTKNKETNVRLWLGKEANDINMAIKSNVNLALSGEFKEYGTVEGVLEMLNAHGVTTNVQFMNLLHLKKISCILENNEIFEKAYQLFEKRVEAEGLIKYNATGIAYEILVERLNEIPEIDNKQNYEDTRGILKEYV